MNKSLNELFEASGFRPITVDGQEVHAFYAFELEPGDRLSIEFLKAPSPRVQGISLRAGSAVLRIDESESSVFALWEDTAPRIVEARYVAAPEGRASVEISNRWRHDDGVEDEWSNNAGMLVRPEPNGGVLLVCSDGYGDPSFGDLVVRVTRIAGQGELA